MFLQTERLIMRPWRDSDAERLYVLARDPAVGPIAGWPAHQSPEESRRVLREVLSAPETLAITQKEDGQVVGCVGLKLGDRSDMLQGENECELGYWLGKPFWGQDLMTEAAREMLRHAFVDLGMVKVWCGYYEGNERSRRVQEKCGFRYQWTTQAVEVPLMHETRVGHVSLLTREDWEWDSLYRAAQAVRHDRQVSEYVQAGGVAAALLSASGKIYTGVCVDTACTLGVCAERNAIFHMLTCGEQAFSKVLALMPDGSTGAPCGACRELMAQLMPQSYKNVQIMMHYAQRRVVTLGELTPEWWI